MSTVGVTPLWVLQQKKLIKKIVCSSIQLGWKCFHSYERISFWMLQSCKEKKGFDIRGIIFDLIFSSFWEKIFVRILLEIY